MRTHAGLVSDKADSALALTKSKAGTAKANRTINPRGNCGTSFACLKMALMVPSPHTPVEAESAL